MSRDATPWARCGRPDSGSRISPPCTRAICRKQAAMYCSTTAVRGLDQLQYPYFLPPCPMTRATISRAIRGNWSHSALPDDCLILPRLRCSGIPSARLGKEVTLLWALIGIGIDLDHHPRDTAPRARRVDGK